MNAWLGPANSVLVGNLDQNHGAVARLAAAPWLTAPSSSP